MEWKDMVDLQRELVRMGAKLSIVQRENARLKEELAKKEHDYRLLGEYYECAIQREDELADLMWEKEEEIESNKDFIKELGKTNEVALDKLATAAQMLVAKDEEIELCSQQIDMYIEKEQRYQDKLAELEKQVALLQQQKCRAEGKLEKAENYLRMFTGRENW